MLKLQVFQKAYQLSLEVHRLSLEFPKREQFALADQLRRCSKAICSLLVEGFGRNQSPKEKLQYVRMANGSNDETKLWLQYAVDLGYLPAETCQGLMERYEEVGRMLHGLQVSLTKEKPMQNSRTT